jgi:hypothetical protein
MSTVRFIIDAGPANLMAKFLQLDSAVGGRFLVSEEVRRELLQGTNHPDHPRRQALFNCGILHCRTLSIYEGSTHALPLRAVKAKGFAEGEIQSIAVGLVEPDAIFVTQDKSALFVASAELGAARAWTSLEFWNHLHCDRVIDETSARTVMQAARNNAKELYAGSLTRFAQWFVEPSPSSTGS